MNSSMLVKDLADMARRLKPITDSTYVFWQKSIKPIKDLSVKDVDNELVLRYRMEQIKPWGPLAESTLKMRIHALQAIWNVGIKGNFLKDNPWIGHAKDYKKGHRVYPFKNFEAYSRFHNDPYFLGYWYHGFRSGELAGLLPDEIVLDADIPYFDIKNNSIRKLKNEASRREVPIHKKFRPIVSELKTDLRKHPGKIWSMKLSKHVGHGAHGLRHNFITRMRRAGIEYSIAMAIVGHTPMGETASYGNIYIEDTAKALDLIE